MTKYQQLSLFSEEAVQTVQISPNAKAPTSSILQPLQASSKKRRIPYASVTQIAELMANEKPCYYATWLRTQYYISTPSSSYDSTNHDKMVIQRTIELKNLGYNVAVEDANKVKVNGQKFKICVSGIPDIIAIKDKWVVIEDCKSGKKRQSHYYQVLLYMLLLRHADNTKAEYKDRQILGRLIYSNEIQDISGIYIDQTFIGKLHQTLKILTSSENPDPHATHWNCRYCTISNQYCSLKKSA